MRTVYCLLGLSREVFDVGLRSRSLLSEREKAVVTVDHAVYVCRRAVTCEGICTSCAILCFCCQSQWAVDAARALRWYRLPRVCIATRTMRQ